MDRLGPYDLEGEIGRGGMGRVFRARHRPTGALRALKLLDQVPDLQTLDRFRREVEALARAGGEGVVPIHESGVEGGKLFFAMGLMPGGSLRARLRKQGPLPWRDAVSLVASLARTLEKCHSLGLVHRDVKPDNVLFDDRGVACLADFGCVRDLAAASLTETGTALGTPHYMAPEQLDGQKVDARANVFALGVLLHELVTGEKPHEGRSHQALYLAIRGRRRKSASKVVEAPTALDAIIDRALEADPVRRTPSADALAQELEALAAGKVVGARTPRLAWVIGAAAVVGAVLLLLLAARRPGYPGALDRPEIERGLAFVAGAPRGPERERAETDLLGAVAAGSPAREAVLDGLDAAIMSRQAPSLRALRARVRAHLRLPIDALDLAAAVVEAPSWATLAVDAGNLEIEGDADRALAGVGASGHPAARFLALHVLESDDPSPVARARAGRVLAGSPHPGDRAIARVVAEADELGSELGTPQGIDDLCQGILISNHDTTPRGPIPFVAWRDRLQNVPARLHPGTIAPVASALETLARKAILDFASEGRSASLPATLENLFGISGTQSLRTPALAAASILVEAPFQLMTDLRRLAASVEDPVLRATLLLAGIRRCRYSKTPIDDATWELARALRCETMVTCRQMMAQCPGEPAGPRLVEYTYRGLRDLPSLPMAPGKTRSIEQTRKLLEFFSEEYSLASDAGGRSSTAELGIRMLIELASMTRKNELLADMEPRFPVAEDRARPVALVLRALRARDQGDVGLARRLVDEAEPLTAVDDVQCHQLIEQIRAQGGPR